MSTSLAGWNIKEGLAESLNMLPLVEGIRRLDADVVVLSDAYSLQNTLHGSRLETLEMARNSLMGDGYVIHEVEYDDTEPWHHDRNLMVLNRLATISIEQARFGTRNALDLRVRDRDTGDTVRVAGFHGDDRSRYIRTIGMSAFLATVEPGEPTALVGDSNDMHREDMLPRLIRARAIRTAPHAIPPLGPLRRVRSQATRLVGMTNGASVQLLEDHDFRDADPTHAATFGPFQLDRAMLSPELAVKNFRRYDKKTSDHRAIRAVVLT